MTAWIRRSRDLFSTLRLVLRRQESVSRRLMRITGPVVVLGLVGNLAHTASTAPADLAPMGLFTLFGLAVVGWYLR